MKFPEKMTRAERLIIRTERLFYKSTELSAKILVQKLVQDAIAKYKGVENPYQFMVQSGVILVADSDDDSDASENSVEFENVVHANSMAMFKNLELSFPSFVRSCSEIMDCELLIDVNESSFKLVKNMAKFNDGRSMPTMEYLQALRKGNSYISLIFIIIYMFILYFRTSTLDFDVNGASQKR